MVLQYCILRIMSKYARPTKLFDCQAPLSILIDVYYWHEL